MTSYTKEDPGGFIRDRSTWFAYMMLGFYGYLLNALGPLTPFLRTEMNLAYTTASLHFSAFAAGMLVAGFTADRAVAMIGRRRTLWLGASGMAAGAVLLLLARYPIITIGACLLMGILGTFVLAVVPAALADRYGDRRAIALMEANVMGSACATLAPLAIGAMAYAGLGWRAAIALPVVALGLIYVAFRKQDVTENVRQARGAASTASLSRAYWAYWTLLVLVVSVEFCVVFWAAEFLRTAKGLTVADAALATSLFLGAMLAGRVLGSGLLRRAQGTGLLLVALGVAALGFLIHWQTRSPVTVAAGLVLAGLGVANLYPLSLSLAVGAAPGRADAAAARASLASGTAILALPLLLGRLADVAGITRAYGLVGILIVLAVAIVPLAGLLSATEARKAAQSATGDV